MSKYIDADALKENFTCAGEEWINNTIDDEPSIDIVRCGECVCANHELSGIYCGMSDVNMGKDGFCSIGKRKRDE